MIFERLPVVGPCEALAARLTSVVAPMKETLAAWIKTLLGSVLMGAGIYLCALAHVPGYGGRSLVPPGGVTSSGAFWKPLPLAAGACMVFFGSVVFLSGGSEVLRRREGENANRAPDK